MEVKHYETDVAGRTLHIEFGKVALQADGAAWVRYGDSIVLATAGVARTPREGVDFLPLTVDYEERWYATGKISGSRWVKREGRPSETAILTSRMIDRPIRPLFPKGFRNDVQVIAMVLAADMKNDTDIMAINGASIALMVSSAPFEGPVGAVRVGRLNGEFVVNPLMDQMEQSELDLVVVATKERVIMIEAGAKELSEDLMYEALELGFNATQPIIALQEKIAAEFNPKKHAVTPPIEEQLLADVSAFAGERLVEALRSTDEAVRNPVIDALRDQTIEHFKGREIDEVFVFAAFEKLVEKEVRRKTLEEQHRPDGRALDQIRTISGEAGILPTAHGSALFTRGESQALSVVTLASPSAAQIIESMDEDYKRRYMHHYNFPPFSTGEVRQMRSTGRREIGHGALAEKALMPVLPSKETFPYTIRVVSEILSSNGSTSMAATCGSTLSLMDGGVPITRPVSGIAMGLVSDKDNPERYAVLSDIRGLEDFTGDMDFKIAGTERGITAIQLDTKIHGLTFPMIKDTLTQGKIGRAHILGEMLKILAAPRPELSKNAPRISFLKINPEKIRDVIGKGGETIQKIIAETGCEINVSDDGAVDITSRDAAQAEKAIEWIKRLTWSPAAAPITIGQIYQGRVTGIKEELGAFVEFVPGKDGLVHISQIADHHVNKVSDELKMGQLVTVKLIDIDSQGRVKLSIKEAAKGA